MRNTRGYSLIELIAATALSALFLLTFQMAIRSGIHTARLACGEFLKFSRARVFFLTFGRDLGHFSECASRPFTGSEAECAFPVSEDAPVSVRYFLQKGVLFREADGRSRKLMREVRKFSLEYPYRPDSGGDAVFLPFWEDTDRLPRAIQVSLEWETARGAASLKRVFSLPQGKFGALPGARPL